MKKRKLLVPVLGTALMITAFPGSSYLAKADDQLGNVQEILLVKNQEQETSDTEALKEIFRSHSEEGERSEALNTEALTEWKKASDTAVLIIGRDGGELEEKEDKPEEAVISESQQQIVAQVAQEFEQVVVLFNNYRPAGLDILDQYDSIKTVTMIDTDDEEEMMNSAQLLCRIVSGKSKAEEEKQEDPGQTESESSQMESESEKQSETAQTEQKHTEVKGTESESQSETTQSETKETAQTETPGAESGKQKETETARKEKDKVSTGKSNKKAGTKDINRKIGDVNGDGVVDTLDATVLMQKDKKKVTKELLAYADVNGDKKINGKDVELILKYASKEISEFRAEKQQEDKK